MCLPVLQIGSSASNPMPIDSQSETESPQPVLKILEKKVTPSSETLMAQTPTGAKFSATFPKKSERSKLVDDIEKCAIYDWLAEQRGVGVAEVWASLALAGDPEADSELYQPDWKWVAKRSIVLSGQKLEQATGVKSKEKGKAGDEKAALLFMSLSTIKNRGEQILKAAKNVDLPAEDAEYVSFQCTVVLHSHCSWPLHLGCDLICSCWSVVVHLCDFVQFATLGYVNQDVTPTPDPTEEETQLPTGIYSTVYGTNKHPVSDLRTKFMNDLKLVCPNLRKESSHTCRTRSGERATVNLHRFDSAQKIPYAVFVALQCVMAMVSSIFHFFYKCREQLAVVTVYICRMDAHFFSFVCARLLREAISCACGGSLTSLVSAAAT